MSTLPDHAHRSTHVHAVSADADRGRVVLRLVLLVGFMACEVVAGILARSLALLSDAGHMLTDVGALALSFVVIGDDCHAVRRDLEHMLDARFEIEHTTLQVDHVARQRPITIGGAADGGD